MGIFRRSQRSENWSAQSTIVDSGSKPEKHEGGFMAALEDNAREILLFLASLIFLLFHQLEGQTGSETRYLGKKQG
jgi:hypothetical protein